MSSVVTTVILHGFSGDSASLGDFVNAYGHTNTYAVDMPEFGTNHRPYDRNWPSYASAVMDSIRDAAGRGPYRIIGHSQGAMIAYALAVQFPDDVHSIALVCPPVYGSRLGGIFLMVNTLLRRLMGDDRTVSLHQRPRVVKLMSWLSKVHNWPSGAFDRFHAIRLGESEHYTADMMKLMDMLVDFPKVYDTSKVAKAAVILPSRNDRIVGNRDIQWLRRRLPRATVTWVRGGHAAPVIFPQEVASALHTAFASGSAS